MTRPTLERFRPARLFNVDGLTPLEASGAWAGRQWAFPPNRQGFPDLHGESLSAAPGEHRVIHREGSGCPIGGDDAHESCVAVLILAAAPGRLRGGSERDRSARERRKVKLGKS